MTPPQGSAGSGTALGRRPDEGPARPGPLTDAVAVLGPSEPRLPLVMASPHSGRVYPASFLAATRLDPLTLRKSEDAFVDELMLPATANGIPLVAARFPRAFLDVNREPFELDPEMFDAPLPAYAQPRSPRVAAGLGTIPRVVAQGEEIYGARLSLTEALDRIATYYRPYHTTVRRLVEAARTAFGYCVLIDGHSMPSALSVEARPPLAPPSAAHFVLGDCHGSACHPALTDAAQEFLARAGFRIARNAPYSGGHTTRHYGRPAAGVHALQIEVARSIYMDEKRMARRPELDEIAGLLAALTRRLAAVAAERLGGMLRAAE